MGTEVSTGEVGRVPEVVVLALETHLGGEGAGHTEAHGDGASLGDQLCSWVGAHQAGQTRRLRGPWKTGVCSGWVRSLRGWG